MEPPRIQPKPRARVPAGAGLAAESMTPQPLGIDQHHPRFITISPSGLPSASRARLGLSLFGVVATVLALAGCVVNPGPCSVAVDPTPDSEGKTWKWATATLLKDGKTFKLTKCTDPTKSSCEAVDLKVSLPICRTNDGQGYDNTSLPTDDNGVPIYNGTQSSSARVTFSVRADASERKHYLRNE